MKLEYCAECLAVTSSLVSNREHQTKPLAEANAATKVVEGSDTIPPRCNFKAVTFQASGSKMSNREPRSTSILASIKQEAENLEHACYILRLMQIVTTD